MRTDQYIGVRRSHEGYRVVGNPRATLGRPLEPSGEGEARQGIFAEWRWETPRLEVTNDRYGLYPLYYYQDSRRVLVAESLPRLIALGAPRGLDFDALAVFLRLEIFPGDDTPFARVKQLPPGATLVWDEGRFSLRGERPAPRPVDLSPEDSVEAYAELFRRAVARRLPDDDRQPIVVPLSGGQDSRHILFELLAQGRRPRECVTVTRRWSPKLQVDARLATEVARATGVRHQVLTDDAPLLGQETRKNALTNLSAYDHSWMFRLADHVDLDDGALVLDGLGGDILSACGLLDPPLLRLYADGDFARLADRFLGDEAPHRASLCPEFYARVGRDRAVARLAAELARHADARNPLTEFYIWNRTRRMVGLSPYSILGRFAAVDTPYLDHDLFDFLIARPPAQLDPTFHKRTIRAAYPGYAAIPFSELVLPVADRTGPFARHARDVSLSMIRARPGTLSMLRKGYVMPRLARCVADRGYAMRTSWLMQTVTYLNQLDTLARYGVGPGSDGPERSGPGVMTAAKALACSP